MTEKEKMLSGMVYSAVDRQLLEEPKPYWMDTGQYIRTDWNPSQRLTFTSGTEPRKHLSPKLR